MASSCDLRIESLADHFEPVEQVGLLRFKEWAYGARDPAPLIEITAKEAGPNGQLPITPVAIDLTGSALGAVGLDRIDNSLNAAESAGRTPWIVGMVVRAENRKLGVGRQLLESLQDVAAYLATLGLGLRPATMRLGSIGAAAGRLPSSYSWSRTESPRRSS